MNIRFFRLYLAGICVFMGGVILICDAMGYEFFMDLFDSMVASVTRKRLFNRWTAKKWAYACLALAAYFVYSHFNT